MAHSALQLRNPESPVNGPGSVPTAEQVTMGIGGRREEYRQVRDRPVLGSQGVNVPNTLRDVDMVIPRMGGRSFSASEAGSKYVCGGVTPMGSMRKETKS